jgi:hypothetical protein
MAEERMSSRRRLRKSSVAPTVITEESLTAEAKCFADCFPMTAGSARSPLEQGIKHSRGCDRIRGFFMPQPVSVPINSKFKSRSISTMMGDKSWLHIDRFISIPLGLFKKILPHEVEITS